MKLLSQAEKLLIDEQGLVPLFFLSSHNIVSSPVKSWKDNVMNIHRPAYQRRARLGKRPAFSIPASQKRIFCFRPHNCRSPMRLISALEISLAVS